MYIYNTNGENSHTEGGLSVVEDTRHAAKLPSLYQVLLLNDDYTPMEFVIEVLQKFFDKTQAEAAEITLNVHHQGRGICGVFPFDIAETKTAMVNEYARRNQHPLQCVYEKA